MDTSEGVFNSFRHVISAFNLETPSPETFHSMIGPSLVDSFKNVFHFPDEEVHKAMAKYREYYLDKGMFQVRVYDGLEELLKRLTENGCSLYTATCKPEPYARSILKHLNLDRYFTFIGGSDVEEVLRIKKVDIINYVIGEAGIKDKSSCIMIGDRKFDIEGAKQAGIASVGILYGFGDRAEMEECGADYIEESPESLGKLLLD